MTTTITTRIALILTLMTLAFGPAQAAGAKPPPEPPAGEGVICAWAIYAVLAEVGRRCFPDDAPEFQAELRSSVAKIDAYVAKNSKATPEDITRFKRDQSHVDLPKELVCQGDGVAMYQSAKRGGVAIIRQHTDSLLARAGEPTWGTCL
jgi:hypothetical protein